MNFKKNFFQNLFLLEVTIFNSHFYPVIRSISLVYDLDLSDPIIGTYIKDNFPDGTYILKVEITVIEFNLTQTNISD